MMRATTMVGLALLLSACLGSAPPAPPVRWFDAAPGDSLAPLDRPVAVSQAASVGTDFVFRVGPRELVYDGEHRWAAEPARVVAQWLPSGDGTKTLAVEVMLFEFDLQAAPKAKVGLVVGGRGIRVYGEAEAASRAAPDLADAMAQALGQAREHLLAVVAAVY